jgi:hypothetical protein
MAKAITLEMLLTQFSHHAHDNAAPGGRGSPSESAYSGSDDLDDPDGGGADGSLGSSDDEGCSPGGTHGHGGAYGARHAGLAHGVYGGGAYYGGGGGVPALAYGGFPMPLRLQPCGSLAGACGSAATMFSGGGGGADEEDCCDTYDFHFAAASPGLRATGVSQYESAEAGPHDTIASLLNDFAAAGAAAAAGARACAAGTPAGMMEGLPGCSGGAGDAVGAVAAAEPFCGAAFPLRMLGAADAGSKRDLASSLSGDDVGCASPLKRLRLAGGSAACDAFAPDGADDELPICYADQRTGSCGGAAALDAAVVREQQPAAAAPPAPGGLSIALPPAHDWSGPDSAMAAACGAAAGCPATPAAFGCGGAAMAGGASGAPMDLLDALPSSIRSCLADAAALYLANDAMGLVA